MLISIDPSTGEEIGRAPLMDAADVAAAVTRARSAQHHWAALSFRERGRCILRAREIALDQLEEIATLISRETGKPATEAISMEIVPTLDLMHYFADHTSVLLKRKRISLGQYNFMARKSYIVYKPLAVVGIIFDVLVPSNGKNAHLPGKRASSFTCTSRPITSES